MTKLLEQAISALGRMSPEVQDTIAQALLGLIDADEPDAVEAEHREAVSEGLAQADRGAFAAGDADAILTAAFRGTAR
ncbi:hypothetical protein [Methylobacterium sp. A54F]